MYDDWYEPSEFDIMIDEFKTELRNSVKKEIQDEIIALKNENARLQDIKINWDNKCKELRDAKLEYENAKRLAISEAKKMRLHELFSDYIKPAWYPDYEYEYIRDKCTECDNDGYIHFKSPQGHDCKELCDCRKKQLVWTVHPAKICEIITDGYPPKYNPYRVVFDVTRDKEDEFRTATQVYDGESFDKVDSYRIVFLDKEKCEEYCRWKTENNRRKIEHDRL